MAKDLIYDERHIMNRAIVAEKRRWALYVLGGECVECSSKYRLEFDHIEPSKKSYDIMKNIWKSYGELERELAKCQILCKSCHIKKTKRDNGQLEKAEHGSPGMYNNYKCRCRPCKDGWAKYTRDRNSLKRQSVYNLNKLRA